MTNEELVLKMELSKDTAQYEHIGNYLTLTTIISQRRDTH